MKERIRSFVVFGIAAMLASACATPAQEHSLPAHPFARWVTELETGRSKMHDILDRFGSPDEIEESVRGGAIWRYAFSEIDWPKDDPLRPVVAADGTLGPRAPSTWARIGHGFRTAGRWRLLANPGHRSGRQSPSDVVSEADVRPRPRP